MPPRVVHFEICAEDPDAMAEFYSRVFGWTIDRVEEETGSTYIFLRPESEKGPSGGIIPRQDHFPPTINTVKVRDIDAYAQRIVDAGGRVTPILDIPAIGQLAYCQDPEGTTFGILQPVRSAPK